MVNTSPDPDLVELLDPISKLSIAVPKVENDVSFALTVAAEIPTVILTLPPELKNHLISLALVNVTETSCVADVSQPSEAVVTVCSAAEVVNAVAFGQPAATDAASVARSVVKAALIAIVSPVLTAAVDDKVSLVWLAMLAITVNREFHCAAVIVSPAETVEIVDSPNP